MKKTVAAIVVLGLWAGSAVAQPAQERTRAFNAPIGWVGVAAVGAGIALMVPWGTPGEETWDVFDEEVCVTSRHNEFDVDSGACETTEPLITAGLITLGAGAALMWLGFHRVTVRPTVSWNGGKSIGGQATVRW